MVLQKMYTKFCVIFFNFFHTICRHSNIYFCSKSSSFVWYPTRHINTVVDDSATDKTCGILTLAKNFQTTTAL